MKNEVLQRYRKPLVVALAVAGLLIGVWWIYGLLDPAIARSTRRFTNGLFENNPRLIFSSSTQTERQALGLTEEKFASIWSHYFWPKLQQYQPLDNAVSSTNSQLLWSNAALDVRTPTGKITQIDVVLHRGEDEAKHDLMERLLLMTWALELANESSGPTTPLQRIQNRLSCMRRDRNQLEGLGLDGLWSFSRGYESWDDIDRRLSGILDAPGTRR